MTAIETRRPTVVDYDSNDYDYRTYWLDRAYEERAEFSLLRRTARRLPNVEWAVDLGGGFGRNVPHLLARAAHVVLVDYSTTNLTNAARRFAADVDAGRLHLVRADLHSLPLRDRACDAAFAVRVLHHLPDLDRCLPEMMRVVSGCAVLDVPIKHHVLARLRHPHDTGALQGPGVRLHGDSEYPFASFSLGEVRRQLRLAGFDSDVVASVNNFRRWDRYVPAAGVRALGPVVGGLEALAQRAGRGWWGPNQFVVANRDDPPPAPITDRPFAALLHCPGCHGDLDWSDDATSCPWCDTTYARRDGFWDFTAAA